MGESLMRLALAASVMLTAGSGRAASPRLVSTTPGKDQPIGIYAVVRSDCSVGAAPDIRVIRPPAHGAIMVDDVRMAGRGSDRCAPVVALARRVTYRPSAGFVGQDEVIFDIVDRETGQADSHPVTIVVQPGLPNI